MEFLFAEPVRRYAANKIPGIRAVLCYDVFPAVLSKNDNNGNVLCTGAWFMEKKRN